MSRVIFVILLLGGLLVWWHWRNTPDPKQRRQLLQKAIIGGLIVISLILVAAGRMHWLGAVFAGMLAFMRQALPLAVRYFPMLSQLYRSHAPRARSPNTSTVSSRVIRMTLDHDTGKLSGVVLEGPMQGRSLDDMDEQALRILHEYCRRTDMDSARLLESYLQERFGEGQWTGTGGAESAPQAAAGMSVAEALQILGLKGTPTGEEITRAYRRIIQQLHPDRGGSEYFSAKANEAREILMKRYGSTESDVA